MQSHARKLVWVARRAALVPLLVLAGMPAAAQSSVMVGGVAVQPPDWEIDDYADAGQTLQEVVDAWASASPAPDYMESGAESTDGDYYLMVSPDGGLNYYLYSPREGTGSFGGMAASNAPATPPGKKVSETGGMVGIVLGDPNPPVLEVVKKYATYFGTTLLIGMALGYGIGKASKKK